LAELEDKVIAALKPLHLLTNFIEGCVHDAMDHVPKAIPPKPRRVLFEAHQESLGEAIMADLIEHLPVVGPIVEGVGNFFRIRDAARKGEGDTTTRLLLDVILPLPANTRRYIQKKLREPVK